MLLERLESWWDQGGARIYLSMSVYDVSRKRKQTVMCRPILISFCAAMRTLRTATCGCPLWLSSVSVLYCQCHCPCLIWSSDDLSIINCVVRTVCGVWSRSMRVCCTERLLSSGNGFWCSTRCRKTSRIKTQTLKTTR